MWLTWHSKQSPDQFQQIKVAKKSLVSGEGLWGYTQSPLSQKPKSVSKYICLIEHVPRWAESETNRPFLGCRVSGKEWFCSHYPSPPPFAAPPPEQLPPSPQSVPSRFPAPLPAWRGQLIPPPSEGRHRALCPSDHSPETGPKWGEGKQTVQGSLSTLLLIFHQFQLCRVCLVPGAVSRREGGKAGTKAGRKEDQPFQITK